MKSLNIFFFLPYWPERTKSKPKIDCEIIIISTTLCDVYNVAILIFLQNFVSYTRTQFLNIRPFFFHLSARQRTAKFPTRPTAQTRNKDSQNQRALAGHSFLEQGNWRFLLTLRPYYGFVFRANRFFLFRSLSVYNKLSTYQISTFHDLWCLRYGYSKTP